MSTIQLENLSNYIQLNLFYQVLADWITNPKLHPELTEKNVKAKGVSLPQIKHLLHDTPPKLAINLTDEIWGCQGEHKIYANTLRRWFASSKRVYTLSEHISQLFAVTKFKDKPTIRNLPFDTMCFYLKRPIRYLNRAYHTIILTHDTSGQSDGKDILLLVSTKLTKLSTCKATENMWQFAIKSDHYRSVLRSIDNLDLAPMVFHRAQNELLESDLQLTKFRFELLDAELGGNYYQTHSDLFDMAIHVVYNTIGLLTQDRPDKLIGAQYTSRRSMSTSKNKDCQIYEIGTELILPYGVVAILNEHEKNHFPTHDLTPKFVSSYYRRPRGGIKLGLAKTEFVHSHVRGKLATQEGEKPRIVSAKIG